MKKEIDANDNKILNIVNGKGTLIIAEKTIQDLIKDFQDEIEKLEALNNYISDNDPKVLKRKFPDE